MSMEGRESNKPDLTRQSKIEQSITGKEGLPSSSEIVNPRLPTFRSDSSLEEIPPGPEQQARIQKLLDALDTLKGESKSTPPNAPSDTIRKSSEA